MRAGWTWGGLPRGQEEPPARPTLRGPPRKQGSEPLAGREAAPPGPEPTSYFTTREAERGALWAGAGPAPSPCAAATWPGLWCSRQDGGRRRRRVRQSGLCAFGPGDHGGLHGEPEAQVGRAAPRSRVPDWGGGGRHSHPGPRLGLGHCRGTWQPGRTDPSGPGGWPVLAPTPQAPASHTTHDFLPSTQSSSQMGGHPIPLVGPG